MAAGARVRPRRSRGLLLLFVLLLAGGAWGVVRWVAHQELSADELAFVARPYLMYSLKPDYTRAGEPLRTADSLGYRGAEIEQPKPAGRTRIVCLGGSTTYGFLVADDETWPAQLQSLLAEARPDLDVEVINAGVESYTTAESLANLAFRVLDLEPDVVLIHHAANDVRPRRYANFDASYDHYRKVWNGSPEGYESLGGELGGINFFIQKPPPDPPGDPLANLARSGTGAFRRNLLSMIGIAQAHHVQVLLTSMPYDPAQARSDLAAGIDQHNRVLAELAAERGLPLVDLAADLAGRPELFLDAVHVGAEGQRAKALPLAEELSQLLP